MRNKTVFRANDSDVCAPIEKKGKIIHKRYLCKKKNEMDEKRTLAAEMCLSWVFNRNIFREQLFFRQQNLLSLSEQATRHRLATILHGQILMSAFGRDALNNKMNLIMITPSNHVWHLCDKKVAHLNIRQPFSLPARVHFLRLAMREEEKIVFLSLISVDLPYTFLIEILHTKRHRFS